MVSILLLAFQYKPVQTWAAKKATAYLSKEWGTVVDIKSLYIKPFSSVVLEDLYVLDKQKDTLLSAPKLTVDINGFSIFSSIKKRYIDFTDVQLDDASFYLKKQKDSTTNLQFIIDYFDSGDTTKKTNAPWTLDFRRVGIKNLHFRYKNQLIDSAVKGVNFEDLDVKNFNAVVRNIDLKNHLFKANLQNLSLNEKSGFVVKNLSTNATVDTNQILLQQLYLQTKYSLLKNHFRMGFNSFSDFSDFERKVTMDGDFKNAHLSSKDVAYFTSGLEKVQFDFGITGRIKGRVDNLKARNMLITTAQSTYIKGDFSLKGLPDWENTFMELDIDQVATNKKDIDYLMAKFTGKSNAKVPAIIAKFGNVNFSGNFSGLQNDFVAYGTFKTKLGRFDTDINLKINKAGVPSYSGKLTTNQFDLGNLIDNDMIGRTSFNGQVKGSGDDLKTLNIATDAKIKTITFKGYTYNNVAVKGTFRKKLIDGLLTINDRNVKLKLDGSINLNSKLPAFDFTGSITNANLDKLKLITDTVTISTNLTTKFTGSNIDNLNGSIFLSSTRLVNPQNNYVLDSLYLAASGSGTSRLLDFRSDVADGSIKGKYSISTLPDYFKTVVKKYIPSLKTDIKPIKPQSFEFNLKIKNIDPLLAVFVPKLKVPDQGNLVGQFNSAEGTATLGGFIKTVEYNKIVIHDIILDESTSAQNMGINLSVNKIDLTDSLYIKDISITNFLQRDSLNFNIKLSDKNAANQLDLYGLVEFGRDTTAKLKLLPSDVVLERESWKLQDQVRIRLLDGKTQVSGFDLSNGEQQVSIDGFISDKPDDKLKLVFHKFRMSTLDQLTKPSGVLLKGALSGDVVFSSLLKTPGVDANLGIDTLMMNKTLVGNVRIISNLDNDRKKAIVRLNILNRGLETMDIEGAYSLAKDDENVLDFDVNMNQTEAIIFTPFIKTLVSDVKGTISTNLKLTGTPKNPKLNGDLSLNNTGLTVNYLKTPYTLNDRLEVENSVIKINKLELKDGKGGKGIVDGTVDLNNISNPELNVEVNATNLLALNTTFKDNHLYYGTAYGSGRFAFTGPTDNMKIDIKATTQAGTVFNIPLNTSSTAGDYDFIHFVSHTDTTKVEEDKAKKFNGVTLNFDLTADEKTVVKIITDYGKLEGSGVTNNLKLNINSLGDFEMFGDFLISTGKFEFTAKNFISKNFAVNQGGTIRWTGDPANAEINLNAVYEVRTDIAPLYTARGLTSPGGNRQVLVQAELILTKSLLLPTIDFDFSFPTDPSIKEDVNTYLADNNNRSQQALSIIVRRNFTSGAGGGNINQQVISTAGDAVSEFAFNQLNSFIAQSNIKFIDLNIRSFNEASASLRFFNDRLMFNGSLFTTTGSNNIFNNTNSNLFNSGANNLRGDFEALYRIRKDGNLTARYSYRVLSGTALSTFNPLDVQYVNGIGLVYQRDFDSIGEFLRNIFRQSRRATPTPNPAPVKAPQPPAVNYKPKEEDEE